MPSVTAITLVFEGEEIIAAAMLDPLGFVAERENAMDRVAAERFATGPRYPITWGKSWGLFLPGDRETVSLREQYGDELADLLDAAIRDAPERSLIAWKVVETIPRGQG